MAAALAAIATNDSDDDRGSRRAHGDEPPRRERKRERSFADRVIGRGGDGEASGQPGRTRGKRFNRKEYEKGNGREYPNKPWTKYRIEVGYTHGVRPSNIVGAITSESDLIGSDIGGIDIQTHFTILDLPQDLSESQIKDLQNLKVAGQALRLSIWDCKSSSVGKGRNGKPACSKKRNSRIHKPTAKNRTGKRKVK